MTHVPAPAPETCAAAIARAETAEQIAAERLDALAAVREAIGIAHAATAGDESTRTAILLRRVMHLSVFLDSILRDQPQPDWLAAHSIAYLRERLAEHPATGCYRTWDEAADRDAWGGREPSGSYEAWVSEGRDTAAEPEPDDCDPGPEVDDEGGMSEFRHMRHEPEPWS